MFLLFFLFCACVGFSVCNISYSKICILEQHWILEIYLSFVASAHFHCNILKSTEQYKSDPTIFHWLHHSSLKALIQLWHFLHSQITNITLVKDFWIHNTVCSYRKDLTSKTFINPWQHISSKVLELMFFFFYT